MSDTTIDPSADQEALQGPMVEITVNDLGYELPVGVKAEGGVKRALAFKPWRSAEEKYIGEIRNKNRNMGIGEYLTEVLAFFLTKFGPYDMEKMPQEQKKAILRMSPAADVYHAWIMLRIENLGDDHTLVFDCPHCEKEINFSFRVGSMTVKKVVQHSLMTRPVQLRDGLPYLGKVAKLATVGPVQWGVYESMYKDGMNIGAVKHALIAGAVCGLDTASGQVSLSPKTIDLTKYDIEVFTNAIGDAQPGPDFSLEVQCKNPACYQKVSHTVNWTYDAFFSAKGSTL